MDHKDLIKIRTTMSTSYIELGWWNDFEVILRIVGLRMVCKYWEVVKCFWERNKLSNSEQQ